MHRPQFSLKTLLWLMVVVAAFLGGMALQRGLDNPAPKKWNYNDGVPVIKTPVETMTAPDGSHWLRMHETLATKVD